MPVDAVRDAAVDVLLRVFERQVHLDVSLDKTLRRKQLSDRGRRFLTQVVYGTLRHLALCDYVLRPLLHQPAEKLPMPIRTILRMGVYQGLFLNQVTRPAMVHTSVDLAKKRGHIGTANLVNAVLKRVPETLDEIAWPDREQHLAKHIAIRYSLPSWIVSMLVDQLGAEDAEMLAETCAHEAPITLRANTLMTTTDALRESLAQAGTSAEKRTAVPEELTVESGGVPVRSKLLAEGSFFIQDPASMLAPHLLEPRPGDRVLDMCAAPGGKTTHIAALAENRAFVVANDVGRFRLARVMENVGALGARQVALLSSDGTRPAVQPGFDKVLLDAPCTGLGTIRRHPDLKWRVTPHDVDELAALQEALLRSAIGLCKNGGLIVYSVCTFTQRETRDVIDRILRDALVVPEDGPEWMNPWKQDLGTYRTFPHRGGLDGFFLTRLRKQSST